MFLFILYLRYQCQLSLFLELNFNCHVPTVLGKKFREYSACLSLCHEMFIKLFGHFRYLKAYNRNFTVYFPFTVESLYKDTSLLQQQFIGSQYCTDLFCTVLLVPKIPKVTQFLPPYKYRHLILFLWES